MIKQILGKLPKKPSKSADACDGLSSNVLGSTRTSDYAGYESGNGKDVPNLSVNPTLHSDLGHGINFMQDLILSQFEVLPNFRDFPTSEKQNCYS